MTREEIYAALAQSYPQLIPFFDKPGVFEVFDRAFSDVDHPWTDAQFDFELRQTDYFRNTTRQQRELDQLMFLDPATAKRLGDETARKVDQIASQLGVTLTPEQGWLIVSGALAQDWDENEITHEIVKGLQGGYISQGAGDAGKAGNVAAGEQAVREMSTQYGVPISPQAIREWSLKLLDGTVTQQGLQAYFVEQAKSLYPSLAGYLDTGGTVKLYAAPYAQIASSELGINPNDFVLSDPKWGAALQQIDPKTGARTAMTLSSWLTALRTDPQYGYDRSPNGLAAAAQFNEQLGHTFGAYG